MRASKFLCIPLVLGLVVGLSGCILIEKTITNIPKTAKGFTQMNVVRGVTFQAKNDWNKDTDDLTDILCALNREKILTKEEYNARLFEGLKADCTTDENYFFVDAKKGRMILVAQWEETGTQAFSDWETYVEDLIEEEMPLGLFLSGRFKKAAITSNTTVTVGEKGRGSAAFTASFEIDSRLTDQPDEWNQMGDVYGALGAVIIDEDAYILIAVSQAKQDKADVLTMAKSIAIDETVEGSKVTREMLMKKIAESYLPNGEPGDEATGEATPPPETNDASQDAAPPESSENDGAGGENPESAGSGLSWVIGEIGNQHGFATILDYETYVTNTGIKLSEVPFDKDAVSSELVGTSYGTAMPVFWFNGGDSMNSYKDSVSSSKGAIECNVRATGLYYSDDWLEFTQEYMEESANDIYTNEFLATTGVVYDEEKNMLWYCTVGRDMNEDGSCSYVKMHIEGDWCVVRGLQKDTITLEIDVTYSPEFDEKLTEKDLISLRALLDTTQIGYLRLLPYIKILADGQVS